MPNWYVCDICGGDKGSCICESKENKNRTCKLLKLYFDNNLMNAFEILTQLERQHPHTLEKILNTIDLADEEFCEMLTALDNVIEEVR